MNTAYVPIDINFPAQTHHLASSKKLDFSSLGNALIPVSLLDIESSIFHLHDAEDALAWFELQIALYKTKQQQIRVFRNRCLPVSKLPAELLSTIFRYHNSSVGSMLFNLEEMKEWLWFSQVCHAWRQTALADAQLWSRPLIRCSDLAKEFIARAGGCPLDIDMCGLEGDNTEIFELVFRNDKWLQKICGFHMTRTQIDHYFPNVSFSTLKGLHLSIAGDAGDPNTFPLIVAPLLERMSIYGCVYPLHMQPLKYLTQLTISAATDNPYRLVSVDTLLKVIAEAPNLAFVNLIEIFEEASGIVHIGPRVPMTRLKSLELTDRAVTMLRFLTGVELPTTILARNQDYPCAKPSLQEIQVARFAATTGLCFDVMLADSSYELHRCQMSGKWGHGDRNLFIGLRDPLCSETNFDLFFSQLLDHISLDDIEKLKVSGLESWSIFPYLPSLSEITVHGPARGFIRSIGESSANKLTLQSVFPRLSAIRITHASLESNCMNEGYSLREFADMLGVCRSLGMPLQKITMEWFYDSKESMEAMKEMLEGYEISLIYHH